MSLRVLVVDSPENSIESLLRAMQGGNHLAVSQRVMDKQELADRLRSGNWDMVMVNDDVNSLSPEECCAIISHYGLDTLTVAVMTERLEADRLESCATNGVDGLLSVAMESYSLNCIQRLSAARENRRKLARLEALTGELQERYQRLLSNATDAVAYLHEGMHIHANAAYQRVFGFTDQEELISTPFVDLVHEEDRACVKALLGCGAGNDTDAEAEKSLRLRFRNDAGDCCSAEMKFVPTSFDGEACLQVVVTGIHAITDTAEQIESVASVVGHEAQVEPVSPRAPQVPPPPTQADPVAQTEGDETPPGLEALDLFYRPVVALADIETECFDIVFGEAAGTSDDHALSDRIAAADDGDRYDLWAVRSALEVQAALYKRGQSLHFMTGMGRASLQAPAIAEEILALFHKRGLDTGSMIIRVRQKDILESSNQSREIISHLRGAGFRFCIDDYCPDPDIDAFIEQSRVHFCRIRNAAVAGKALSTKVGWLHDRRIRIIAGGADTSEYLSTFWEAEVDLVQGKCFQDRLQLFRADAVSGQMEVIRDAV